MGLSNHRKIRFSAILFYIGIFIYILNICGILFTVIINSFGTTWYEGPFPTGFTLKWYEYVIRKHDIGLLLQVTIVSVIAVVGISLLIAFPAAYVMAKRKFKFKGILLSLFLLPILIPPMTYGMPLASLLYRLRLAPHMSGLIISNMVPTVPFIILVLTPFIEQVGENIESAATMLGANRIKVFLRVTIPLIMPGILTACLLSIVRVISMFELSFLVAGGRTQTLIVALFSDVYSGGSRPLQGIDALAVIFFVLTMSCFAVALKFVSPTQMVFRVKAD